MAFRSRYRCDLTVTGFLRLAKAILLRRRSTLLMHGGWHQGVLRSSVIAGSCDLLDSGQITALPYCRPAGSWPAGVF